MNFLRITKCPIAEGNSELTDEQMDRQTRRQTGQKDGQLLFHKTFRLRGNNIKKEEKVVENIIPRKVILALVTKINLCLLYFQVVIYVCIWLHFSMQVKVAFLWTRNLSHRQLYEEVLRIVVFNDCELFFKNLLQKDASISTNIRHLENLQQRCKVSKIYQPL